MAVISWTGGDIIGDSVVSTNGTSVFAISGSASQGETRVNGVNFIHSPRATAGGIAQDQSPGNESLTTTIQNDNSDAFENGGLGAVGEIILGGWWGGDVGNTATLTLTGLTIGNLYEVQIFANDARNGIDEGFVTTLGDGEGGAGLALELNNLPNGSAAGDFGLGTFTADSTTQTIELAGFLNGSDNSGRLQVNAIQLRNIELVELLPGAVPLINEFLASNSNIIDDDNGNSTDFIEFFNAGEDAVNLAGYTLTDDPNEPAKYVFPTATLGGGQYLTVFAGDDDDPTTGSDLFTGFGLSSGGEYLGFFDPSGDLVSEFGIDGTDFPAQFTNVSFGLVDDGNFDSTAFFTTPTPGAANVGAVAGVIDSFPTVSVERGFYDEAFDVDIVSQTAGATLVYTTDGSEPSLTNGTQVQAANANAFAQITLNIAETTSLRTGSFLPDVLTLGSTTNSYVFLDDVLEQTLIDQSVIDQYSQDILRDALLDLPTVSFNFDDEIGRFDAEQRTSIEYLAADGSEGFQVDAGISPFGGSFTDFAKRNFRVNFRGEYGTSELDFPLFEGFDDGVTPATTIFDSLDFRAGSHDREQRGFGLSNRFVDETLLAAGHVATHGRFVHLYLNGQYWGQYHLRERFNDDFLVSYEGGDEEDFESINGNANQGNNFGPGVVQSGSGVAWNNVNNIVNDNSLSPSQRYAALSGAVNLEQYVDWLLIFMAGQSENEFRAVGSSDGSVPFIFHFNDADGWLRDPLDGVGGQAGDKTDEEGPGDILEVLLADGDPEFLSFYADRIQRMFLNDGPLSVAQSTARLQELIDQVELSVILEEARWGTTSSTTSSTGGSLSVAEFNARSQDAIDRVLPNIVESSNNILVRLQDRGVFPDLNAPEILVDGTPQFNGDISGGEALTFAADGPVYYTTDGSDPRLPGGGLNPNAISFDSGLTQTALVQSGDQWRFEDSAAGLDGFNWQSPDFNDSQWETGFTQLGFGDSQNEGVENNGQITTYFRQTFDVDSTDINDLTLRLQRDDGAVVYLNGVEIVRNNLPNGDITSSTLASSAIGGANENIWHEYSIDPSLLQAGSNTLAVEIHQASFSSSDVTFDAELLVTTVSDGGSPIILNSSTQVNSRTLVNGDFSPLSTATLLIPASQSDLRISEIQFNPSAPTAAEIAAGFTDNDDFEFIELFNPSTTSSINLDGVQLSDGVIFDFGDIDLLPGERVVVVEDVDAFMARYGDSSTVLGQWSGSLSNGGEEITLLDSSMDEILSVNYGDSDPWHSAADGFGFSLVLEDPANTPVEELGKYYSWRASTVFGGTPGAAAVDQLGVVVNEVLANTDASESDAIELFNPTSAAIDISGWYLSGEGDDLLKYQIPAGTVIAAGGYLVFDEADFNATLTGFALSGSQGDQVYLSQASEGVFVGLQDAVEFGATFVGESLGRLPNGTGRLTRLESTSFGSANGEAEVGPLVISEVNYHPESPTSAALAIDSTLTDNDLEYIEVANPTSATIDLTNWRIRGEADYDFVAGTTLAAGNAILVISFDPTDPLNANKLAAFEAHYGIGSDVTIVGGLSASLSNSSGRISLQQPDTPDLQGNIPNVVVDEVVYDDLAPWADADGNGLSLERDDVDANGNFASSWIAATPTPGAFESPFLLGDANLDGVVNFLDISPFILLISTNTFLAQADIDGNGVVNFLDISPFISVLSQPR